MPTIPDWHRGSVLWLGPDKTVGFAMGRFYPGHDRRRAGHTLTDLILAFKSNDASADYLAEHLSAMLSKSSILSRCSCIACVPPKPGETYRRFDRLLNGIASRVDGLKAYPDALECVRDYGSIKDKGAADRAVAVNGAFESHYDWKKKGVVLIDDVLTSGATSNECANALRQSNASEVLLVGLGKDQFAMEEQKNCKICGKRMTIRKNRKDNSQFWGCTGYKDGCRYTESI